MDILCDKNPNIDFTFSLCNTNVYKRKERKIKDRESIFYPLGR